MKYYLAGPMQGIPQYNFPLFFKAAAFLREKGYDIVSPAEIDDSEDKGKALQSTDGILTKSDKSWGDFLARDVKLLADGGIGGIVFLPRWTSSRGAKLEATVGLLNGFEFKAIDFLPNGTMVLLDITPELVLDMVHDSMFVNLVNHKGEKVAQLASTAAVA